MRLPASGVWNVAVHSQGEGAWELELDGVRVATGAADAAPVAVRTVRGLHGVRLRARGPFTLAAITVEAATAP